MIPCPPSFEEIRRQRRPLRDVNREMKERRRSMDRLAIWITRHVGTIGFFLLIFAWTALWLGWNLLAPPELRFDPPMSFTVWLFMSNLIQILLMPLIMIGQNIQGQHSERRAENDLEINRKAEKEIEVVLRHLEYQNALLQRLLEHHPGALSSPASNAEERG